MRHTPLQSVFLAFAPAHAEIVQRFAAVIAKSGVFARARVAESFFDFG